jgi:hypothetical protein
LSPGEFPALAYGSGVIALVLGVAGVATGALGRAVRKAYIAPALAIGLGVLILLAMSAVIEPQCAAGYCR